MNIKFFGHSLFQTINHRNPNLKFNFESFSKKILDRYGCDGYDPRAHGVPMCSEERILFYLKKTKNLDLAIITHGHPLSVFCISTNKDFYKGLISDDAKESYIKNNDNMEFYNNNSTTPPDILSKFKILDWKKVDSLFEKNYNMFFNVDLQTSRYYGALIQIDQYLTKNKIKCIHLIHDFRIPSWFKFSSGIVDTELINFQYSKKYSASYASSPNGVSEKGNKIIEDRMIKYIDQLNADVAQG